MQRVLWPIGPQGSVVASGLLAEIGGKSDRPALGRWRVRQLADGREDGDRLDAGADDESAAGAGAMTVATASARVAARADPCE